MKSSITVYAFALMLSAATTAAAQLTPAGQRDLAYQTSLLSRSMSKADSDYCAKNAPKPPQHDYCQVIRLFIADTKLDQEKGVPPWAQDYGTTYGTSADLDTMMAAMQKFPPN
jgi:hypothetical protein